MKNIIFIFLTLGIGIVLGQFLFNSGHVEETPFDDDDNGELTARQGLVEGKLLVRLSEETQKAAGIRTRPAEDIVLDAEDRAFAKVIDIRGLLDLRSRYRTALAQKQVINTRLENASRQQQRLSRLHKEAGNISTSELQIIRSTVEEQRARLEVVDAELLAIHETMIQQWNRELTDLALKTDSLLFQRLVRLEEFLVLVSLNATQRLSADEAFVLINRRDDRSTARKAYLISSAPFTDTTLQGESFLFRSHAEGLRIGMRLYVWLPGTGFSGHGIHIPQEAIIWYAGKPWAYVKIDDTHFARRSLSDPIQSRDTWLVREGFEKDERIVISGAQTLLSEEFKWAIPDEDDD